MPEKRILVTGARGLLGQKVTEVIRRESEYEVLTSDLTANSEGGLSLDITDRQKVVDVIGSLKPYAIVNAAAYTNVDKAEVEREAAYKINATAVGYLAEAANIFGAKLIHISTDYVFDGLKGNYSEASKPQPVNYYGKTKLAGENLLIAKLTDYVILRTQVLYGYAPGAKMNFVLWVVDRLSKGESIRVVDDQVGNPTLADELAFAVLKACQPKVTGLYHVAGMETVSRYDFALQVADVFNLAPSSITPIKSEELSQPAKRPKNSSFICLKAQTKLGIGMPTIRDSLARMKRQMKPIGGVHQPIKRQ